MVKEISAEHGQKVGRRWVSGHEDGKVVVTDISNHKKCS